MAAPSWLTREWKRIPREVIIRIGERGGVVPNLIALAREFDSRTATPVRRESHLREWTGRVVYNTRLPESRITKTVMSVGHELERVRLLSVQPRHWLATGYGEGAITLTRRGWSLWHYLEGLYNRNRTGDIEFTPCDVYACSLDRPIRCPNCGYEAGLHDVRAWIAHTRTPQHARGTTPLEWTQGERPYWGSWAIDSWYE